MTTREPRAITLTATEMRRQLAGQVDQIRDHGLRVRPRHDFLALAQIS
jgi:hypothetical protein